MGSVGWVNVCSFLGHRRSFGGTVPRKRTTNVRMGLEGVMPLNVLGFASNLAILLEAQRLIGRLVKPVSEKYVDRVDEQVLQAAGIELRREYIQSEKYKIRTVFAGNPADPPLVLIHGHSMSSTFFYRNFADLVDMGYYVIGMDLLGWGRSERPMYTGRTVEDSILFYLDSFDAWRKNLRLEKFSIISHSIGAYLAYEFARTHPGAVDRLMLITPAAIERKLALYRGIYFTLTPQVRTCEAIALLTALC